MSFFYINMYFNSIKIAPKMHHFHAGILKGEKMPARAKRRNPTWPPQGEKARTI